MKNFRLFLICILAISMGYAVQASAEDIDLYSVPAAAAYNPNILIILDTAANSNASVSTSCVYADGSGAPSIGNQLLGIEQCTLFNLIYNLPTASNGSGTVNLGVMFYNATGLNCSGFAGGGAGGCLMQPLTAMSTTNKTTMLNWIKTWSTGTGGITTNSEATGQTMQEAWAYYAGQTGISGRNYSGIAPTPGCQKNFVIYIANAYDNNGTPGDGGLGTYSMTTGAPAPPPVGINNAPGVTTTPSTIVIPSGNYNSCGSYTMPTHSNSSGLYADEWARYMHQYNLYPTLQGVTNITTYGIAALGASCKPDYPALLTSMALYGGGEYFPTYNAGDMYQALLRILNQIQAVNSVFASSSLPVSVNAQGTFLNQVYMGMFRPSAQANPRWLGNLKQYQFIYNSTTGSLQLADAVGAPAISAAGTGFLDPSADSFWTCTSSSNPKSAIAPYAQTTSYSPFCQTPLTDPAPGFWANKVNGVGGAWDLPDGEIVEKGGAAQMLRLANLTDDYTTAPGSSTNPRKLYSYCPAGTGCITSLADVTNVFDTSNTAITNAALGTGPIAITSITSATTVQASGAVPSGNGTTATISITAFSKSGNTVTASVSTTDLAKLSVGSQLKIATGATKYDCNPCNVASINTGNNTFTYTDSGGNGAPTTPYTATIYSSFFTVTSNGHGLPVGQTITFSGCTTYTGLNNTVATITSVTTNTFIAATALSSASTTSDTGCMYTPNTATVTALNHNLPNGAVVSIAGASPAGYNGTWTITVTGTNTFTYQYTAAAPLLGFFGTGATATSSNTTRDALTKWVRGDDNFGDEPSLCPPGTTAGTGNCPNPAVTIRPSVHGDVLHSRPVVLNYGGAAINITSTSDSGTTRTATASTADVANIGTVGSSGNVIFANGSTCNVTVATSTTFTYPTTGCGLAGAQTAATGRPNVVVFYGSNDGTFHAVDGNQPNNSGVVDANAGHELWGFIPSELFGELKRLHDNSPSLLMPSTPSGIIPAPQRKNYSVDGPTGVYQLINGNGTTAAAYIYLSMRRGGRFIYALDVTNPNNPNFLWKHSNADAGFGELGQTWSQPKVAKVNGYPNPVLIFGAGYDATAEDAEAPAADTMGRGIFILDAQTGALVWSASPNPSSTCTSTSCQRQVVGMNYSIPSDITLTDRDGDGLIEVLYVGDVGGNVWRVDLEPTTGNTPDFWQVEKLAALGCSTGPCALGTTPRKILYPPEVIVTKYYDAVFVATGDREHPLWTNTTSTATNPSPYAISPPYAVSACAVTNRAYLLKDTATGLDGSGLTTITEGNLFDGTTTAYNGSGSGYYVTFNQCEKSVNAPLVVAGYVYFGTNQAQAPSTNTCEDSLGEARNYMLSPFSGKHYINEFEGGGFPPSPVSGIVSVIDSVTGKPMQVPFCIGCGGEGNGNGNCNSNSALAGCKPPISVSTSRTRTYWYIEGK